MYAFLSEERSPHKTMSLCPVSCFDRKSCRTICRPDDIWDDVHQLIVRSLSERTREPKTFDELFHILAEDRPELALMALKRTRRIFSEDHEIPNIVSQSIQPDSS
jgi:hypothetical protein